MGIVSCESHMSEMASMYSHLPFYLSETADLHTSAKPSQRLPCFLLRPASTGITLFTPSVHTISAIYSSSPAPEHSSSPQPCRPGGCNAVGAGPCQ